MPCFKKADDLFNGLEEWEIYVINEINSIESKNLRNKFMS
jgi:hypothetical protein